MRLFSTGGAQALKVARLRSIKADGTSLKFFKNVRVAKLEEFQAPADVIVPEMKDQRWLVLLDERAMVTPFGNLLCIPQETLAYGLAGEWAAQEERIKPALMPLTTLCTTALDIVPRTREKTVNDVLKFLSTDTVCFFADPASEPGLREMQDEVYEPISRWFEKHFQVRLRTNRTDPPYDGNGFYVGSKKDDAVSTTSSGGVSLSVVQTEETRERVRSVIQRADDWELSALDKASGEAKSCCVAAMLCAGDLTPEQALEACKTEERYQIQRWGDVPTWHGIDWGLSRLLLSSVSFYAACLRQRSK